MCINKLHLRFNEIFTAFDKLKLIQNSISDSNYSRCGRTDTGVSAICQVISCRLRANCKLTENLPTESIILTVKVLERNELDDKLYLRGLNGVLPSDIRIISWCHVSNEFNARFDCISRTYKYYMPSKGLDLNVRLFFCIKLMNNSSKLFKGNHDFRNLCKKQRF
ncbi:hypothetical protein HZS_1454 [Henneguya salminicola]|nr:hypothetical protein HZS_1454 [Henneguya salminicola]